MRFIDSYVLNPSMEIDKSTLLFIIRSDRGVEMTTINIRVAPKNYFPFSYDTMPLSERLPRMLTTRIRPSGYFDENITDSFYNETLELGDVFSVRMPSPILRWHSAKKATTTKFQGHLSKIFPELQKLSDKDLDALIKDMRNREE